ncbi:hypothetical protein, partial [Legionella sp. 28fT52]|uniref:hypothetical protein n=1 Tax=Legionella sp. 28fT52 TaxID=3410134 RepID=UPI003AF64A56
VLPEQAWVALMERSVIKVYWFNNRIIAHALLPWYGWLNLIGQAVLEREYLDQLCLRKISKQIKYEH